MSVSTARRIEEVVRLHGLPIQCFDGAMVYDLGCGHSDLERDLTQ